MTGNARSWSAGKRTCRGILLRLCRGTKFAELLVRVMAADLIFAPEAGFDLADAYDWYESRRVGLGEEFLASVDACLWRIRRQPGAFPLVHVSHRRALIRRFPYAVFFEHDDGTVTVFAVFHTASDPHKWRLRVA